MDQPAADATLDADSRKKQKRKKDKVRSAWISFAGRIVAQIVGSVATVALGVAILHKHAAPEPRAASAGAAAGRASAAQSAPAATEVFIAVLPLEGGGEGADGTRQGAWTTTAGRRVRSTAQLVDAADEPLPVSRKPHGAGRDARALRETPALPADGSEAVTAR